MLHRRIRRRQTEGSLPGFSPERVGWQETSSNKIIQQEQEEVCRTPNSERGTPAHRQTTTGRKSERHHAEVRSQQASSVRLRVFLQPKLIKHLLSGATCLCLVWVLRWFHRDGRRLITFSPPCASMSEEYLGMRLLPPIRARPCADGRRAWPIGAHGSLWQPPPPRSLLPQLQPPGPESGRRFWKGFFFCFFLKKMEMFLRPPRRRVAERCVETHEKRFNIVVFYHFPFSCLEPKRRRS